MAAVLDQLAEAVKGQKSGWGKHGAKKANAPKNLKQSREALALSREIAANGGIEEQGTVSLRPLLKWFVGHLLLINGVLVMAVSLFVEGYGGRMIAGIAGAMMMSSLVYAQRVTRNRAVGRLREAVAEKKEMASLIIESEKERRAYEQRVTEHLKNRNIDPLVGIGQKEPF